MLYFYLVHPIARCVVRYQKSLGELVFRFGSAKIFPKNIMIIDSLLDTILAYKSFHRHALLSEGGGGCIFLMGSL